MASSSPIGAGGRPPDPFGPNSPGQLGRGQPYTILPITPFKPVADALGIKDVSNNVTLFSHLTTILAPWSKDGRNKAVKEVRIPVDKVDQICAIVQQLQANHEQVKRSQLAQIAHEFTKLTNKFDDLSKSVDQSNTSNNAKLDRIEHLAKDGAKTYASAAAGPRGAAPANTMLPKHNGYVPQRNPATEIVLRGPRDKSITIDVAGKHPQQMVTMATQAINAIPDLAKLGITVRTVHRLPSGDVRIYLSSKEHANALVNPAFVDQWVTKFDSKLHFTPTSWHVVAHRVPTNIGIESENDRKQWSDANGLAGDHLIKMQWMGRKPNAKHASVRVILSSPDAANHAIRHNLIFGAEMVPVEKARRPPQRCERCLRYNHTTPTCRAEHPRCRTCGEDHATSDHEVRCSAHNNAEACHADHDHCQDTAPLCAICKKTDHLVFDAVCPATQKAEAEAREAFRAAGQFYDVDSQPPYYFVPTIIIDPADA
jgi:hypothetical protein